MTAGVGEDIRQFRAAFYADDGLVQSRCPVMMQTSLDTLVSLFKRVGLRTNVSKTKTMVCVPGQIRTCQLRETCNNRMEGHADSRQWQHKQVGCDICSEVLTATLLQSHLETQNGIFQSFVMSWDLIKEDHPPIIYPATFPILTDKFLCPVPGCAGTAGTMYGIRRHFRFLHPQDLVNVPDEGC